MSTDALNRARENNTSAADNQAPIFVDLTDSNKIKVRKGGSGDPTWTVLSDSTTGFISTGGPIGYGPGTGGVVNQATDISTEVTLNTFSGLIFTQTATALAGKTNSFVVLNANAQIGDSILLNRNYVGSGTPMVWVGNVGDGFIVNITNLHPTDALNMPLLISFNIIRGSAL